MKANNWSGKDLRVITNAVEVSITNKYVAGIRICTTFLTLLSRVTLGTQNKTDPGLAVLLHALGWVGVLFSILK